MAAAPAQTQPAGAADLSAAPARSEVIVVDNDAAPENLTSAQDGTLYFGSSKGTIYRALPGAIQAEPWIQADTAGLGNILGVLADDKSSLLWVCSNATGGRGAPPKGHTALCSFDLKTGEHRGTFPFPDGCLCNDAAVAADGSVYITDTMGARVFKLAVGATKLEVWTADLNLRGVDGIAVLAEGAVYVNNFFKGTLFRIPMNADGTAGPITPVETNASFTRPDGLRPSGPATLLQAEGGGRLTEITIDGNKGKVRVIKEGLTSATGVTRLGNSAFVLVERRKALAVSLDPSPGGNAPAPPPGEP